MTNTNQGEYSIQCEYKKCKRKSYFRLNNRFLCTYHAVDDLEKTYGIEYPVFR